MNTELIEAILDYIDEAIAQATTYPKDPADVLTRQRIKDQVLALAKQLENESKQ